MPEPGQRDFATSQPSSESFDDILQAFQAGTRSSEAESFEPRMSFPNAEDDNLDMLGTGEMPTVPGAGREGSHSFAGAQDYSASGSAARSAVPASHMDIRAEADSVRRQVAALRTVAASLRESAQSMEDERSELRSFLDGSRDALDRLEEWVGQQMGLDLRNSPDSVRRYLPLSVVWVITTRLKQLIGLLHASGRTVTVTQEQIDEAVGGLLTALEGVQAGYSIAQSAGQTPDGAFSATFAHVSWAGRGTADPAQGNTSSAGESLSPGTRAEIEREVREQLRRELEDEVRDEVASTVRRDEEERLRQELQIEVRRQLLAEFTGSSIPTVGSGGAGSLLRMMQTSDERAAKPVQVTSEQSPEALEVFREEAQEHLQTITSSIAQLEVTPGDLTIVQTIRRAMHTLKGAAGMMGFLDVQRVAHASEDVLDGFVEQGTTLSPEVHSLLLDTAETLDQLVSGQPASVAERRLLADAIIARYTQLGGKPLELPSEEHQADFAISDVSHAITPDQAESEGSGAAATADLSVRLKLSKLDELVTLFGELLVNRSVLEERIERAGRLIADTVVVSERLRDIGSQLETRFEAATLPSGRPGGALGGAQQGGANWNGAISRGGNSGPVLGGASAHEFDELELDRYTEFHRLSRGLSEGVADVITLTHELETLVRETQTSFARENRLTSDFQDRLLKARLVPLQSLVPRLYRAVRASAFKERKDVEFYAEGMDTEIDRKVFEEVAGPLLHLVRNAVNHGIETPNARELAGKPHTGRIIVSAAYEGNQVAIAVRDDGAGIDPERIRATAVARGWIDAYTHLSERDAINLIFRPGISTAESVTEESGRGVGLDVVRDTVTRLRGTVEVESGVAQGTIFTMKFPISLQIARAVLVRVGNQVLALPMAVVDQIGRLDYYKIVPGDVPALDLRGERYPLAHLASYLRVAVPPIDERASVLLVNAGKRRVALIVDAIVAQQEVVAKPLGPHLREVSGVAGATVLGNGQVVLILELHELLTQVPRGSIELPRTAATIAAQPTGPVPTFPGSPTQFPQPRAAASVSPAAPPYGNQQAAEGVRPDFVVTQRIAAPGSPGRMVVPPSAQSSYVLVVDDSPSVRRVVSGMLKANGWEVQTARDGVEALEAIARQIPVAVLLDIEMPRMDGYELMATVRSQEQYRHLPLIVLTSRAATKHQQRALQLGADAYVVKPYRDDELLNTISSLVQSRR
jgi:chemotaxis protein histidine kinase CheA/ActR/RegA family two-component response regulator